MDKILGVNKIGLIKREDGQYVCWDNDIGKWYLSENMNKAQRILGDKELNFKRLTEMYRNMTGDKAELKMELKVYVHHMDSNKSGFIDMTPMNVAVLYDYVQY